jgi:hypothetical protein
MKPNEMKFKLYAFIGVVLVGVWVVFILTATSTPSAPVEQKRVVDNDKFYFMSACTEKGGDLYACSCIYDKVKLGVEFSEALVEYCVENGV